MKNLSYLEYPKSGFIKDKKTPDSPAFDIATFNVN